jgi:glycosyltransferase involved in cell wall biosynthesis
MALVAKALARVSTRIVVCQHAVLSQETTPAASWKYRILPIAYRLLRPMIGGIVAVSDWTANDFGRVCGIKRTLITRIYNPVIDETFGSKLQADADHPWFHEPTPVFVSAGRLVKEKDQANLLRGFALHRQRRPARLFLMGTGSELESLQRLACHLGVERDVKFAGFVQNPLPYIRQAHCFVLTSRFEGFGVAIVEALACGTPVISTDCPGGPAEILHGGRYGRLVPVGDPDALASAMDEDLRTKFPPEKLRARAEAFSVSASVQEYAELLRRLRPMSVEAI